MPNEPRLQTKDILLRFPEAQYRSCQETSPRAHTISSMTLSSFTATTVTSTSCLGSYMVIQDGSPRGQQRQINTVSGTTAGFDRAISASTSVTTISTWLPADVPVRVTTAGSATSVVSSPHANVTNEPDSFYVNRGIFLYGKGGANVGGAYSVSAFTTAAGTFTTETMPASAIIGDVYLARSLVRPEGPVDVKVDAKLLSRRIVGYKDADQAVPINTEANVSFVLPQRPITASAPNAVAATPPLELGAHLSDVMTETKDTGSTVSSATATTVVAASGTGFTIGGFALLNTGEAFQILNKATNTLTCQTGLITNAVAAGTLYASAWYKPKTTDFRTCGFDFYRGRLHRQVIHGCMPTINLEITRDQLVKFNFAYMASDAIEYPIAEPITQASAAYAFPLLDTTVPSDGKAARICIDGVQVLAGELKMNIGFKPGQRASLSGINQADGCFMDLEPTTGSMTILADNDDIASFRALCDRLRSGDTVNFLYQKGSAPTDTFCIGMPAMQLTSAPFAYNNGQGEYQINFQATLPAAVRGNSFADGLPALAIGYL